MTGFPRWEVRADEPGGLAWVTDPDPDEDQGFDIEELFRFLDWPASPTTRRAVEALRDAVVASWPDDTETPGSDPALLALQLSTDAWRNADGPDEPA